MIGKAGGGIRKNNKINNTPIFLCNFCHFLNLQATNRKKQIYERFRH